jgi:hypothetical protein
MIFRAFAFLHFDAAFRSFTQARFGLLVQSVQSGGACEHAGMQQGDVIVGVGSSLLDSSMSCVLQVPNIHDCRVCRVFTQHRYEDCLSLIKSACKKADEDYDDPFIVLSAYFDLVVWLHFNSFQVLTVFHPHGLLPSALTASTVAIGKSSSSAALSTLSVHQCSF